MAEVWPLRTQGGEGASHPRARDGQRSATHADRRPASGACSSGPRSCSSSHRPSRFRIGACRSKPNSRDAAIALGTSACPCVAGVLVADCAEVDAFVVSPLPDAEASARSGASLAELDGRGLRPARRCARAPTDPRLALPVVAPCVPACTPPSWSPEPKLCASPCRGR